VLLAAVSLDRIGLGILLIMAFSVGLAAVLTLVCLGLIYARRFLDWMAGRQGAADGNSYIGWIALHLGAEDGLLRIAPVGGACALMAVGSLLTIRALSEQGFPLL
jgi:ABC-type nickel/cobalt efflux system permease component RcnA